jgi:hypothetical protein
MNLLYIAKVTEGGWTSAVRKSRMVSELPSTIMI